MKKIIDDLRSPSVKDVILDTDCYNEVDDQYALAYAMLSSDKIRLLSVNAAPFLNSRVASPEEGMEKSYNEIFRIMKLTDQKADIPVYRGSREFMSKAGIPVDSPAADNIVNTVMGSEGTVYIVAIGAITNVASAILKCPEICNRAVVIWLGGHALHWQDTREFNLRQDVLAAQTVFDCGIPFVQIPCMGVCGGCPTTVPELEYYLKGKNELCDYLVDITAHYTSKPYGWSKVLWDVAAVGVLTLPSAFEAVVLPSPVITPDCRYAFDMSRHPFVYVRRILRDPLYADLFHRLSEKE